MIGFVDNSTGQTNDFASNSQPTPEHLLALLRHDAQLWNDLLYTSGGALELPKCSYQYLHWIFTHKGAPILQPGRIGSELILKSGDRSSSVKIPFLSAHKAHTTKRLATGKIRPATKQNNSMSSKQKSDAASVFIQSSPLDRAEAWTYYFAIYLPSIGFPLSKILSLPANN